MGTPRSPAPGVRQRVLATKWRPTIRAASTRGRARVRRRWYWCGRMVTLARAARLGETTRRARRYRAAQARASGPQPRGLGLVVMMLLVGDYLSPCEIRSSTMARATAQLLHLLELCRAFARSSRQALAARAERSCSRGADLDYLSACSRRARSTGRFRPAARHRCPRMSDTIATMRSRGSRRRRPDARPGTPSEAPGLAAPVASQ